MEQIILMWLIVMILAFKIWLDSGGENYRLFGKKVKDIIGIIFGLATFALSIAGVLVQSSGTLFKGSLFLAVTSLYILLFFVGLYPASFAYRLSRKIINFETRDDIRGFWQTFDQNKLRRNLVMILLMLFCIIIAFLNLSVFSIFYENVVRQKGIGEPIAILIFFVFLSIVFFSDYISKKDLPPIAQHQKEKELKRIVENLCITAGIAMPEIRIVGVNVATAFVTVENFNKQHCLNVSIAMLNLLEADELEAVIAHELSHIISGQVMDYRRIGLLLSLLRTFGGGLLLLALSAWYPVLAYLWMIILLSLSLDKFKTNNIYWINSDSMIFTLFVFFMPSFSVINFISCLIFYFLSYYEDLSADLNAILLTRYPEGLYKAIKKIGSEKTASKERLNREMSILYFLGENVYSKTPQNQPSINDRIRMIETIDGTLKNLKEAKAEKRLACPSCGGPMSKMRADSHYMKQNIELDKCPSCGGVWFDQSELQYAANLLLLQMPKTGNLQSGLKKEYNCPLCGIVLDRDRSSNLPPSLDIYNCPSCEGSFLTETGLETLEKFKELNEKDEYGKSPN